MRRPVARYSELGFTFVVGYMVAFGIAAWFHPQPALNVTPLFCQSDKPPPVIQPGGVPPSYERYVR